METLDIAVELPANGDCERCLAHLAESLELVRGVAGVSADAARSVLRVTFDPAAVPHDLVECLAKDLGAGITSRFAHETLAVTDLDCADCAEKIEKAMLSLPGVVSAAAGFASGTLRVEYETARVKRAEIVERLQVLGYDVATTESTLATTEFQVDGMDCADCARTIERNVGAIAGVAEASVNFTAGRLTVRARREVSAYQIVRIIVESGYQGRPIGTPTTRSDAPSFWRRNRRPVLTGASGLALAAGFATSPLVGPEPAVGLFALAMLVGGYHIARSGIYGLLKSRTVDMNVLMSIAAIGAAAIGEWAEGATVVFLFALGNLLESYTMDRARSAIRALMALAPNEARVRRDGVEVLLPVEQVRVGEIVSVRPGERVPLDGRVVGGGSSVNQAPVTGESTPVEKAAGDEVFAGSINERGYLDVAVSRPYAENFIARVIRLIEEAQAQRAPTQRFIDRFARAYTPAVIAGALLLAVVPALVFGQPFTTWFYRSLVLLVIACPCALVISTPVSIVAGIARAARLGILIKGGAHLETTGRVRAVAFDKTGTLTVGRLEVTDVLTYNGRLADDVLALAASVEARSEHPLAAAVLTHVGRTDRIGSHHAHGAERLEILPALEFEAVAGRGVRARVDGQLYAVGSQRFLAELGVRLDAAGSDVARLESEAKTVLLVAGGSDLIGAIAVADQIRPGAAAAIAALKAAGVERIVMLTGDNPRTARAIAEQLGIDEWQAELLPEAKVKAVQDLRAGGAIVAMIGDGVNDAPALAAANLGVAMGAAGTDVALETADVALMRDDLTRVPEAIRLGRRVLRVIRQNVTLSLLLKGAFIALAIPGLTTLWLAIFADMGASLLVTLNGLRLLRAGDGTPLPPAPSPTRGGRGA